MSKRRRKRKNSAPPQPAVPAEPTDAVDVVDGIPDRRANPPLWQYLLLAAAGLGWLGVLAYCWLAGGVRT